MSGKEKIVDIDIDKEMSNSFLEYAYSVIYSRALPDARDGLKPVQRRIVYQMNQMGLLPDKSFVKSARVVGDVMGKLHPHGDAAIYDAMVRLAQDFSVKLPLVIGHGNFGSLHDSPAAPRYTEAKLSQYSLLLCKDIEENTVDFLPNYDNKLKEPEVLPASFPNLLVNGSSGIAVGMATNIPSHNLNEVLQACIYLIENPGCQISDLQKYILGPDFPGGAIITNKQVLREIYNTGRGLLKVRAKPNIEIQGKRKSIVFTELPYLVDPERIISKIKDFINSGKISGISAVGDFTDRKRGLRLQIDIKSGYDEKNVLAQLYKWTPLEETFGVNLVALVNGHPQTLNLKQALAVWIKHRIEVLKRRSKYRLEMAENRLHLVGGLQIAINSIDKVIKIIRNSQTQDDAKKQLKTDFSLDDLQANYILDLRLRKLTKFSRIELEKENADLKKTIANLSSILSSDKKIQSLLIEEINQVKDSYSSPRKTSFIKKADSLLSVNEDDIISPTQNQIVENSKNGESTNLAGKDGFVLLTSSGKTAFIEDDNLKKSDLAEFNLEVIQEKNFNSPNILQNILQRDAFKQIIKINLSSDLLVLLSDGYFTRLQVSSLPNINKLNDLENNNFA
ncbi:MAG: DNA topoisomerase 4 subunit A, partial [Bifidobacteriaceae bacterium]|nr:DNA topoisomerase 4 subunit A [Bifidobacteriaceae bacterium]